MDTLIFTILHRCYSPERIGLLLLEAPRQRRLDKEDFAPSTSHFQEVACSSSRFAISNVTVSIYT